MKAAQVYAKGALPMTPDLFLDHVKKLKARLERHSRALFHDNTHSRQYFTGYADALRDIETAVQLAAELQSPRDHDFPREERV